MRAFLAVVCLACATALAGEFYKGTIRVDDAGTMSNFDTGYFDSTAPNSSFALKGNSKITLQCDQAAWVTSERKSCDAGNCLKVAADEKFPTSTNALTLVSPTMDGGSYSGGVVGVAPVSGVVLTCRVFERTGTE